MGKMIQLTGCNRFNFRGETYENGKVYRVGDTKAALLLQKEDEFGRKYFSEYVKPKKATAEEIAAKAAAAALAAAREAETLEADVVERPDDSGDAPVDVVVDPDAAVEVDTDDDPDLDLEDEPNPDEYDPEADRDDGTAVEV